MKKVYNILTSTLIGIILLSVFSNWVYDKVKDIPVLSWIAKVFVWIRAGLNYEVRIWIVLLVLFLLISILGFIGISKSNSSPTFLNWKSGVLEKWKWSWEWTMKSGGWDVTRLTAHCPTDDTHMIPQKSIYGDQYYCPRCKTNYEVAIGKHFESKEDIHALILDEARRMSQPKINS
ncbi:MAG: hypothetical protein J7502_06340 [Flavisolibacter sp.]|nr:hypothetical protein [Flavisolibacter sp.]